MKKTFTIFLLVLMSPSAFTRVEVVRKCLNRALIKSMNIKLQNLTQNNSIDEEITFSCNNINGKSRSELIAIREEKMAVMKDAIDLLQKNGSIKGHDVALLSVELDNKKLSMDEMCPVIESNYESQLRRIADHAFSHDLKKCPKTREQFQAEYFNIMSSTDIVKMPIMDACTNLVNKIKNLKEQFQDRCDGNISEKPKLKKFRFNKVGFRKDPTSSQILQIKILKAFKSKRMKYLAFNSQADKSLNQV